MKPESDSMGAEVVRLGGTINVLPDLYQAEQRLDALHAALRALHYGLCAFLVRHGHSAADDLALTIESGQVLLQLDRLRDELRAVRRRLSRVPS